MSNAHPYATPRQVGDPAEQNVTADLTHQPWAPDCPRCSRPMLMRQGPRGPFWGCPKFPDCRGTRRYASDW